MGGKLHDVGIAEGRGAGHRGQAGHEGRAEAPYGCRFLADDADERVTQPLLDLASEIGVQVVHVPTMQELGKACSIEVGAAAAAVLKSDASGR